MRLFIALTLPDDIIDRIEILQVENPVGRIVPRENLHLTLAFLGDVDDRDAEAVHDGLAMVAADAFPLTLSGLGSHGAPDPSVVWIGCQPSEALVALHRKVRGALHGAGLMPDRQRFRPHVTIARLPRNLGLGDMLRLAGFLEAWGATTLPTFLATEYLLIRSHLGGGAARHEPLARYPLAGGWRSR